MYCTWCGSTTHTEATCPKLNARKGTSRMYCSFCGSNEHSDDNCPKKFFNVEAREIEKKRKNGSFDGIDLTRG